MSNRAYRGVRKRLGSPLETHSVDKYGRTLVDVLLPDGTNLNQEFVTGLVLWYRKCTNLLQGGWKKSVQRAQGTPQAVLRWSRGTGNTCSRTPKCSITPITGFTRRSHRVR